AADGRPGCLCRGAAIGARGTMPRCGYGAGRPSAHARILVADDAFRLQLLSAPFGRGCDAGPATAAAEGSGIYGETCIWRADRAAGAETQEAKQRPRHRD